MNDNELGHQLILTGLSHNHQLEVYATPDLPVTAHDYGGGFVVVNAPIGIHTVTAIYEGKVICLLDETPSIYRADLPDAGPTLVERDTAVHRTADTDIENTLKGKSTEGNEDEQA
eukprot:933841_1